MNNTELKTTAVRRLPSLSFWGCVGQEFDTIGENEYGFVVEHDGEPLFVRRSECEVLED